MFTVEILVIAAVLLAIGYPLFRSARADAIQEGDDYHRLLYRKEASYLALKDLEFDYKTGKIDEDDYHILKKSFEKEAVGILKGIDALKKEGLPNTGTKQKARLCSACGKKLNPSDNSCKHCGNKIS